MAFGPDGATVRVPTSRGATAWRPVVGTQRDLPERSVGGQLTRLRGHMRDVVAVAEAS